MVKIAELTAYHVRIPLRKPIRHASHTRSDTDNVVIRLVLDDGRVGHGEGVPRDYVTGETIDSVMRHLQAADLAAQLGPCGDFAAAVAQAERLCLPRQAGDERGIVGNAARCAVEIAYLDAAGRHFGQSLSAVTRLLAPDCYQPRPRVYYSGAITSARGFKLRVSAWAQRIYGLKQIKVKVGIAGYDDADRLRTIRARVGQGMDLRVDANEAWTADEAVERIRALEPHGITSVEQPVPHEQLLTLAALRRQVRTPIMLDESLCGAFDAERAIAENVCDLFNLRLSKCGGFIPSLRLARRARQAGLACQLGCQIGETALLSAAGRHFACTVGGLRYLEGSYDRRLVRESLGARDLTFGYGGAAPALAGPGLGIDLDPKALGRVSVREVRLI